MSIIEKTIDELSTVLNKINDVTIIAMGQQEFKKILAILYGLLNNYKNRRESNLNSVTVIEQSHQMLEKIVRHHIKNQLIASQDTVHIFNENIKLLLLIVNSDFGIDENSYSGATQTSMFLRALKASGINPPGYFEIITHSRWRDSKLEEELDSKALYFAAQNIKKYSIFIFEMGKNGIYIQDPFNSSPTDRHLGIYSKIKSLTTSYNSLPSQQESQNT
ncbi:hypothetical protein [Simplicispira metamorpha]|uniref:Uncharacterized protein n=1 Tax=Simplicispira metamorpha TaxID=80881 RepID=A0A4R2MUS2_9BURK|nr:hypothetical protein [Simplicispira metamorpha]TCP12546.1 hypothetical protein EV674_13719 [Simplicispira metamorpha]